MLLMLLKKILKNQYINTTCLLQFFETTQIHYKIQKCYFTI